MEPTACSSFPFHQPTCTPAGQDPSEKWDINEEPNGDNGDEDDYVDEGEGDEDEEDSKDDKPNMDLSGMLPDIDSSKGTFGTKKRTFGTQ